MIKTTGKSKTKGGGRERKGEFEWKKNQNKIK